MHPVDYDAGIATALHEQHSADIPWVAAQGDNFSVEQCLNCQRYARYVASVFPPAVRTYDPPLVIETTDDIPPGKPGE